MSDQAAPNNDETTASSQVDLASLSPELQQVIAFEEVPQEMLAMVESIHNVSQESVWESWSALPASAQNIVDSFEQFHALVSVSQAFAGVSALQSFEGMQAPQGTSAEEQENYKAQMLDQILYNCVKDMVKQLKKARRDPILKKEFQQVFVR